jgi:hypothetical protein
MSFTCPFKFHFCGSQLNDQHLTMYFYGLSLGSLLSMFKLIIETILIPFQILVPELTALVIKIHKCGSTTFSYLD